MSLINTSQNRQWWMTPLLDHLQGMLDFTMTVAAKADALVKLSLG